MQHSGGLKPCYFIGFQLFDGLKASISLGDAAFQMQALGDPDTMPIDALTAREQISERTCNPVVFDKVCSEQDDKSKTKRKYTGV